MPYLVKDDYMKIMYDPVEGDSPLVIFLRFLGVYERFIDGIVMIINILYNVIILIGVVVYIALMGINIYNKDIQNTKLLGGIALIPMLLFMVTKFIL